MIYFDHNATTPVLPEARDAWLMAVDRFVGNPSSPHRLGARADKALMEAREQLADLLGCHALDIVWTSGATESNNMTLAHLARELSDDAEVWVSAIEHPCLVEATRLHFPDRHRVIPALPDGGADVGWLEQELSAARPAAIALMAANNETGVLQPWREVRDLCRDRGIPFICDAAQWIGKLPATGFGDCDFVSGCAHKFGGPKGAGFLKVPAQGRFHASTVGGRQEEGRRAGTENVPGVLSMMAALAKRAGQLADGVDVRHRLRSGFEARLLEALPGSEIVGAGSERLWNTVSALMPEGDCRQRWVVKLDKAGHAVSTGSACASGKEEASHVLTAMGLDEAQASRALRFSSGWETGEEDWDALLRALVETAEI